MTVPQTTIESAIRATRSARAGSRSLTKSHGALPIALGIVLAVLGAGLLFGGAWLFARGGSSYYAIAGAAVIATGYLLVRRRAAALYVHASMLAATTIWSMAEVGLDWWQLVPRLDVWVVVALGLLLPWVRNRLVTSSSRPTLALAAATALSIVVLGVSLANDYHDRPGQDGAGAISAGRGRCRGPEDLAA